MKKSEILKKAILAAAVTYTDDELIEIIRVLMNDLETAEWMEEREEQRNG